MVGTVLSSIPKDMQPPYKTKNFKTLNLPLDYHHIPVLCTKQDYSYPSVVASIDKYLTSSGVPVHMAVMEVSVWVWKVDF